MKTQSGGYKDLNCVEIARMYRALAAEAAAIDKLIKPFREKLEAAAEANGGQLDLGDYMISLTPIEREVFSIKTAREVLGHTLLKPFLRVSKFNQLRVVEKIAA